MRVGGRPAAPLLVPGPVTILAQPDLEEREEHGRPEAGGHERDREDLAGQPLEEQAAERTRDHEERCRPEREDAGTRRHGAKVASRSHAGRWDTRPTTPPGHPQLHSRWTDTAYGSLHARVGAPPAPTRPSIVLVHGLGVSSRYMVPTARLLARTHEVHALDLPGFGRSSKPERVLDVSGLADALGAWVEAAGLSGAVVVANSLGCQIVAELAAARPTLFRGLILLAPTVDPQARSTARHAVRWMRTVPWERQSLALLILGDYRRAGISRVRRTARFALEDRIEAKLPRVEAPVLVVRGGRDSVVPQRWAREAADLAPRGRLAGIPGAGHCLNHGAPARVTELVSDFARGLAG